MKQTSSLVPLLTNYVFHDQWFITKKVVGVKQILGRKPFLNGLHYKLTNGRTRYQNNYLSRFDSFVSLYEKSLVEGLLRPKKLIVSQRLSLSTELSSDPH